MSKSFSQEGEISQPPLENSCQFQQPATLSSRYQPDRFTAKQLPQPDHLHQSYSYNTQSHHGHYYPSIPPSCYTHQVSQTPNTHEVLHQIPGASGQAFNQYSRWGPPESIAIKPPPLRPLSSSCDYSINSGMTSSGLLPARQPPSCTLGTHLQCPPLPPLRPLYPGQNSSRNNAVLPGVPQHMTPTITTASQVVSRQIESHSGVTAGASLSVPVGNCVPQISNSEEVVTAQPSYSAPILKPVMSDEGSPILQTPEPSSTPSAKRRRIDINQNLESQNSREGLNLAFDESASLSKNTRSDDCFQDSPFSPSMFLAMSSGVVDQEPSTSMHPPAVVTACANLSGNGPNGNHCALQSTYSEEFHFHSNKVLENKHSMPICSLNLPSTSCSTLQTSQQSAPLPHLNESTMHARQSDLDSWSSDYENIVRRGFQTWNTLTSEGSQESLTSSDMSVPRTEQNNCPNESSHSKLSTLPVISSEIFDLVYNTLYSVRAKWYDFGLALGLLTDTLDSIKEDENYTEGRLRRMLCKRMEVKQLTWDEVVVALRRPTVNRNDLAEKIEKGDLNYLNKAGAIYDLSGGPTLEELCSLPVEKVWYQLGVWLGVEDIIPSQGKPCRPNDKLKWIFTAFLNLPIGTKQYKELVKVLSQELQQQAKELLEESKVKDFVGLFPGSKQTAAEELVKKRTSLKKYPTLITALVKVGQREVAEEVCSRKGTALVIA